MEDLAGWFGPSVPLSSEDLATCRAVEQLAKIYGLGLDMRNYDLCRSAFADDAIGVGRNGPQPIDDYLRDTFTMATGFAATQHLIANQYVQLRGDEAVLWSYGIAHHKRAPGEEQDEVIAGVQYRDSCRRFDAGWLIVHRSIFMQWLDMAPRSDARSKTEA